MLAPVSAVDAPASSICKILFVQQIVLFNYQLLLAVLVVFITYVFDDFRLGVVLCKIELFFIVNR